MTIQYVGGQVGGRAGATSTLAVNYALTGGLDTVPRDGDFVVITVVVGTAARNPACAITTPAGFTALTQLNPTATSIDTSLCVSYKRMGATPDTSFTLPSTGNVADAQSYTVQVFRGVDTLTPLDVTPTSATGTGTSVPNPPAITPTTAGAWIVVCSGGAAGTGVAYTYAALTNVLSRADADTNDSIVGSGYYTGWTTGAYDPAASSTGSAVAGADSWAAYTIALRPRAAVSALTDNFNGAFDTAKWTKVITQAGSDTVDNSGGALVLTTTTATDASTVQAASTGSHNLIGSSIFVKVVQPARTTGDVWGIETQFQLEMDPGGTVGDRMLWTITSDGQLQANYQDNYTGGTPTVVTSAYFANAATYKWLRLREASGTYYWDTAPETASNPPIEADWVNRKSLALASMPANFSNVNCNLLTYYGGNAGAAGIPIQPAKFDGLNTAASVTTPTASATYSSAFRVFNSVAGSYASADKVYNYVSGSYASANKVRNLANGSYASSYRVWNLAASTYASSYRVSSFVSGSYSSADKVYGYVTGSYSSADTVRKYIAGSYSSADAIRNFVSGSYTSGSSVVNGGVATGSYSASYRVRNFVNGSFSGTDKVYNLVGIGGTFSSANTVRGYVSGSYSSASSVRKTVSSTFSGSFSIGLTVVTHVQGSYTSGFSIAKQALSAAEFDLWLRSPNAHRTIILDVAVNAGGANTIRRLATRPYITGPHDSPANTPYASVIKGGIDYMSRISQSGGSEISYGDIELHNEDGQLDSWLLDIWENKQVQAYFGDVTWPRADFVPIFNGIIETVKSANRGTVNLKVRDKMQRLQYPLSDVKIGGTGPNKDRLKPIALGENHNVPATLVDSAQLQYAVHAGAIEGIIECRDDGAPFTINPNLNTGTFTAPTQPQGTLTVSVQGDKLGGIYRNTVASLIQLLVQNYGTEADQRFTAVEIDQANFALFDVANPQPVGLFVEDPASMTVFEACSELAASVGARLIMSRAGLLQLVKIELPAAGPLRLVTGSDMLAGSLHVADRTPVFPACKIGFCRNWYPQSVVAAGLPVEHAELFAQEWLTTTKSDGIVAGLYGAFEEPVMEPTLLIRLVDADIEAARRLKLRRIPHTLYRFEGYADMLFVNLGSAMALMHWRFGLENGDKAGQVLGVGVNWIENRASIEVLV